MNHNTKDQPATLTDAAQAPEGGTCFLCKQPLGPEPHFITELPDGEHSSCREKCLAGTEFPYGNQLEVLRSLARLVKNQYNLAVETGKWITAVKSAWPESRQTFEKDRAERIRKLKSGLTILYTELGRFGRRNWF